VFHQLSKVLVLHPSPSLLVAFPPSHPMLVHRRSQVNQQALLSFQAFIQALVAFPPSHPAHRRSQVLAAFPLSHPVHHQGQVLVPRHHHPVPLQLRIT
jgi:hypothetical protein